MRLAIIRGDRSIAPGLALLLALVSPAEGQVGLDQVAFQFEQSLECGHRIWNEAEVESILQSAIAYAPHIGPSPRIAGTHGVISANTQNGYYGGVIFGPVPVNEREVSYHKMTIWGDPARGWTFAEDAKYRAILSDRHPTWLLLEDDNPGDDFEITEELALEVVDRARLMADGRARSPEEASSVDLSIEQIDGLHRFEVGFVMAPHVRRGDEEPDPLDWVYGRRVITAKSQQPGSHLNIYEAGIQFALTDEGLAFVQSLPAYNVFEFLGTQRRVCQPPG